MAPVARLGLRRRNVYLVSDPVGIKRILQDNADNYGRKTRSVDALRDTLGAGLLTTTGPTWRRNRRLAQPAFHKQRLAGFAATMAGASAAFVDRLRPSARPASPSLRSTSSPRSRVSPSRSPAAALLDRDLASDADTVGRAVSVVLRYTIEKVQTVVQIPVGVPTPRNLRFRAALRELDEVVQSLIDERRRAADAERGDLLSMLLARAMRRRGRGRGRVQRSAAPGRGDDAAARRARDDGDGAFLDLLSAVAAPGGAAHPGGGAGRDARRARAGARGSAAAAVHAHGARGVDAALPAGLGDHPLRRGGGRDRRVSHSRGRDRARQPLRHPPRSRAVGEPGGVRSRALRPERDDSGRPRYAYFPFGGGPHLCIGAGSP